MKNSQEFVATSAAAKELALSTATIQKLVECGELLAWKTNGGHRRILKSSIQEYKSKYKIRHEHITSANELIKILIISKNFKSITEFIDHSSKINKKIKYFLFKSVMEALIQTKTVDPNIFIVDAALSENNELKLAKDASKIYYFRKILFIMPTASTINEFEFAENSNSNIINLQKTIDHDWLRGFFDFLIKNRPSNNKKLIAEK